MSFLKEDHIIRSLALSLIRTNNSGNVFDVVRNTISPEKYGYFAEVISKNSALSKKLPISGYPLSLKKFAGEYTIDQIEFEREIKWIKALLTRNIAKVKEFLQLSQEYSRLLLKGDYKNAEMILISIENQYGYSLWLIKNKIAFLQLTEGLESQKKYSNSIKEQLSFKGGVAFITHWTSLRNEGTVTTQRFTLDFSGVLSRMEPLLPPGYPEYFRHHILSTDDLSPEEVLNVVRLDFSRSIIDFYESFILLCRVVILKGSSYYKSQLSYILQKSLKSIIDPRINLYLTLLGTPQDIEHNTESVKGYDLLLSGDLPEAYKVLADNIDLTSDNYVSLVLAGFTKSLIDSQTDEALSSSSGEVIEGNSQLPLKNLIINNLSILFQKGLTSSSEIFFLNKLSLNFSSFEWSNAIHFALALESPTEDGIKSVSNNSLKSFLIHPIFINIFHEFDFADTYKRVLASTYSKSVSMLYQLIAIGERKNNLKDVKFLGEQELLFLGKEHLNNKEFSNSLEIGEKLVNSRFYFYKRQGHKLISESLLYTNQIRQLCDYISENFIREPSLQTVFPLHSLSKLLKSDGDDWDSLKDNISLPIVLHILLKHTNSEFEKECAYAYEDFLLSNGWRKPSEIDISKFSLEKVVYYFKNVCLESIIDTSTSYDSPEEVENERLLVCRKLIEIDPKNKKTYNQEIQDLVKRQVIKSRMQEIEQSKIFVDLQKVKSWALKEFEESYNRYISYLKSGLDNEGQAIRDEAKARAAEMDIDGLFSLSVPEDEPYALFRYMVHEIRDAYTSSPEFGLNRFLSTRIRHGVLESQLRKPLTIHHIITQVDSDGVSYKENNFWKDKIGEENYLEGNYKRMFSKFSARYDEFSNEICTNWIKIDKNNKKEGLFNFTLFDPEIAYLETRINVKTNFNQFLNIVVGWLEHRLHNNLKIIREKLNEEAKPQAREILNDLQKEVSGNGLIGDLDSSINHARTEIQAVFDRVIEWFSPSINGPSTPYLLEDAVSVAEAIIKDFSPNFKAPFKYIDTSEQVYLQFTLPVLVDILYNAFENVVKRSELEHPEANVNVWIIGSPASEIKIQITNNLGIHIDKELLETKLTEIKDVLKSGDFDQYLIEEGGTGFYKIFQSLQDLTYGSKKEAILVFYIDSDTFVVDITLPVNEVEA